MTDSPKVINFFVKLLLVVIIVSSAYVGYSIKKGYSFEEKIIPAGDFKKDPPKNDKDYTQFLQEISQREFFASLQQEKTVNTGEVDRQKLNQIIVKLRLVGIIDDEPQKVIIEDKTLGKSFYLREGESFLDNIRVEKIEKGSVILNYNGESFELYL